MGKYVMKQSKTGPYFVLKAANGEPIGTSEVYSSEAAAKNGIALNPDYNGEQQEGSFLYQVTHKNG